MKNGFINDDTVVRHLCSYLSFGDPLIHLPVKILTGLPQVTYFSLPLMLTTRGWILNEFHSVRSWFGCIGFVLYFKVENNHTILTARCSGVPKVWCANLLRYLSATFRSYPPQRPTRRAKLLALLHRWRGAERLR